MNVRKAEKRDIPALMALLHQVNMVHYEIRPDLFKPHTTKYDEAELEAVLDDASKPIFVFDDGRVKGHAFCQNREPVGIHSIENGQGTMDNGQGTMDNGEWFDLSGRKIPQSSILNPQSSIINQERHHSRKASTSCAKTTDKAERFTSNN